MAARFLRPSLALAAAAWLAGAGETAAAHRMPEVHIRAEATEIGGEPATGLTFRLVAADVLVLLGREREPRTDLTDPEVLKEAAQRVFAALTTSGGEPAYLGGELDGNHVYLYATGPASIDVTEARVLSSVYEAWTNTYEDQREDEPTRMFTQWGEQGSQRGHRHRH